MALVGALVGPQEESIGKEAEAEVEVEEEVSLLCGGREVVMPCVVAVLVF